MHTIETSIGYFAGQDEDDGIQFTADIRNSQRWISRSDAQGFIDRWSDAGYGLSSDDAKVVYVPLNP